MFFSQATRSTSSKACLFREQEKNRDILTRRNFALDHGRTPILLDLLDARLAASRSQLQERVLQGRVVTDMAI